MPRGFALLSADASAAISAPQDYRLTSVAPWQDLRGRGTVFDVTDEGQLTVDLPFAFDFFGTTYTEITITPNGVLCFGDAPQGRTANGMSTAPAASIAPFWSDLTTTFGGAVHVYQDADATEMIVHFDGLRSSDGHGVYNFQTVLHSDGDIGFRYLDMSTPPSTAGIGLVSADGTYQTLDVRPTLAAGGARFTRKPQTEVTLEITTLQDSRLPDIVVAPLENPGTGGITGTVWLDADGDGLHDWGEAGLAGQTVWVDSNDNGHLDDTEAQTQTDATGSYGFDGLTPGRHLLRLAPGRRLAVEHHRHGQLPALQQRTRQSQPL